MKRPGGRYSVLLGLLLAAVPLQTLASDTTLLARSLAGLGQSQGWVPEESLRVYEGNALFELVDGGAALYLEYGFVRAFALRLAHRESRISVELYRMSGPEAAFGIYSYLAAGSIVSAAPWGQQGGRGDGFVLFWKGPYAVSVTTLEGADSAALDAFASAVDRELPVGGTRPEPVAVLQKLDAGDLVFFRGPLGYQKMRGLLPADLLRVGEGVLGTIGECTAAVLLYANADTCRSVLRRALDILGHGSLPDRSSTPGLIRHLGQIYSLVPSGRRLLQVQGSEESKVRSMALRLSSAFRSQ